MSTDIPNWINEAAENGYGNLSFREALRQSIRDVVDSLLKDGFESEEEIKLMYIGMLNSMQTPATAVNYLSLSLY